MITISFIGVEHIVSLLYTPYREIRARKKIMEFYFSKAAAYSELIQYIHEHICILHIALSVGIQVRADT